MPHTVLASCKNLTRIVVCVFLCLVTGGVLKDAAPKHSIRQFFSETWTHAGVNVCNLLNLRHHMSISVQVCQPSMAPMRPI